MPHRPTDDAASRVAALAVLLRDAWGTTQGRYIPSLPAGDALAWLDAAEAQHVSGLPEPGWLVRLAPAGREGPALFLASTRAGLVSDPPVQAAAMLCRLAWHLQGADAADATPLPAALSESVHALRNGLNAAMMNTAVLVAHRDTVPESMHQVIDRIDDATARCAQELRGMVALLEAMR